MIKAEGLTKKFNNTVALESLNCAIPTGCIYGLVGSNGAGKSTLIRLLAGVYNNDGGSLTVDDQPVFGNCDVTRRIAYVPDELYFLPGATIKRMGEFYSNTRQGFDKAKLKALADKLGLEYTRSISQFSKGMKRQAATILALSCNADIILFDETFDGLDPVMRNTIKRIICDDVLDRNATIIITSHSLRELEDTCDQLALLHKGGIVLESEVADLKTSLFKVQIAFTRDFSREELESIDGIEILNFVKKGSVANLIVRGDRDTATRSLNATAPAILDVLPLSLEEVFVYEMQALGYEFNEVLGGEKNEK